MSKYKGIRAEARARKSDFTESDRVALNIELSWVVACLSTNTNTLWYTNAKTRSCSLRCRHCASQSITEGPCSPKWQDRSLSGLMLLHIKTLWQQSANAYILLLFFFNLKWQEILIACLCFRIPLKELAEGVINYQSGEMRTSCDRFVAVEWVTTHCSSEKIHSYAVTHSWCFILIPSSDYLQKLQCMHIAMSLLEP